ncbi:hypothetical protein [Vreelandella populi]|uniref:hypothetical protein n=1 Tax=Vreelandella populi TaxID=2498858 RepID=UPI000F8E95C0|nr:hypothetical protein [Halomonas populi]RUR52862.1 hypothetical protein ELY40_12515 [Halomonas populi]
MNGNFHYVDGMAANAPGPSSEVINRLVASAAHVCQEQEWADIIYLPGTRTFWLLTAEVSDILMEADETLKDWVREEDVETRLESLQQAGIMDSLLAAEPVNFLSQADQQEYGRLKAQKERCEAEIADASDRIVGQGAREGTEALNNIAALRNNVNYLAAEMAVLEAQGRGVAQDNGYTLSGEHFYGGWEAEIEKALETYRTCRRGVVEEIRSVQRDGEQLPIRNALAEYKRFFEHCESDAPSKSERCELVNAYLRYQIPELENEIEAYHDSILVLATLGIATPEWALAGIGGQAASEGVDGGVQAFDDYYALLKESMELYETVSEKLSEWESGTAGKAQLPVFLLEEERRQYEAIQNSLNGLYEQAKRSVEETKPYRTLIWNTDLVDARPSLGYTKRKIDLLVRGDFPLREFSSPLGEKSLSHLSLWQLMPHMSPDERSQLDTALIVDQVLPARIWEAPETALSQWLESRCCQRIEHRAEWHEELLGFFDPKAFFGYLNAQNIEIASLADESEKINWGESLKKILFTGPSREKLRLFDASAQAQMVRLVGMAHYDLYEESESGEAPKHNFELQEVSWMEPTGSIGTSTELNGSVGDNQVLESDASLKNWKNERQQSRSIALEHSWEMKGAFNLAKGELSLGRLELPKKEEAKPIRVKLNEREESEEQEESENQGRELGRYTIVYDVVAKGFLGANVALAKKVGFKLDKDGLNLTGLDLRKQEGDIGGVSAFGGTKAGLEIGCSLDWEPPSNLKRLLPNWQALSQLGMWEHNNRSLDDWRSLAGAKFEVEGSAGAGGSADFVLGMRNGKFTFRLAAKAVLGVGGGGKLTFELDSNSLDLWIAMLHRALVDNNYKTPEWITEEAKGMLGKIGYILATTLLNVGLIAARGKAGIEQLYRSLTGGQKAGPIAYEIVEAGRGERREEIAGWIQQLIPEALGALLYLLSSEPQEFEVEGPSRGRSAGRVQKFNPQQAMDFQQIAMANCLGWIVDGVMGGVYGFSCQFSHDNPTPAQYLFANALIRMSETGQPRHDDYSYAYQRSKSDLEGFMLRRSGTDNTDVPAAKSDFVRYLRGLGNARCATQ